MTSGNSNVPKRASTVALADRCPKCKNRKTNVECTNHICKQCCVKISGYCRLLSHRTSKLHAKQGYVSSISDSGDTETTTTSTSTPEMDSPKEEMVATLFISYPFGTHSGGLQDTPLRWLTGKGGKFKALCHLTKPVVNKSFYACKVTRVEDSD